MRGGQEPTVALRCVVCGRDTLRTYKPDDGGFGKCKCGGELIRRTRRYTHRRKANDK